MFGPNVAESILNSNLFGGSGGGLTPAEKQSLIDVTNTADLDNDLTKTDVVAKLNALNPALGLSNASTWGQIRAAIASMPSNTGAIAKEAVNMVTSGAGDIWLNPPEGYYDGASSVHAFDAEFIPANIKSGVDIFGVVGTMNPAKTIFATPLLGQMTNDLKTIITRPDGFVYVLYYNSGIKYDKYNPDGTQISSNTTLIALGTNGVLGSVGAVVAYDDHFFVSSAANTGATTSVQWTKYDWNGNLLATIAGGPNGMSFTQAINKEGTFFYSSQNAYDRKIFTPGGTQIFADTSLQSSNPIVIANDTTSVHVNFISSKIIFQFLWSGTSICGANFLVINAAGTSAAIVGQIGVSPLLNEMEVASMLMMQFARHVYS